MRKYGKSKKSYGSYTLYRNSSYSFGGNYFSLNLEIQKSQYIRPKVTVHKCAEIIQGRKLYEEIQYTAKFEIKYGWLFTTKLYE